MAEQHATTQTDHRGHAMAADGTAAASLPATTTTTRAMTITSGESTPEATSSSSALGICAYCPAAAVDCSRCHHAFHCTNSHPQLCALLQGVHLISTSPATATGGCGKSQLNLLGTDRRTGFQIRRRHHSPRATVSRQDCSVRYERAVETTHRSALRSTEGARILARRGTGQSGIDASYDGASLRVGLLHGGTIAAD